MRLPPKALSSPMRDPNKFLNSSYHVRPGVWGMQCVCLCLCVRWFDRTSWLLWPAPRARSSPCLLPRSSSSLFVGGKLTLSSLKPRWPLAFAEHVYKVPPTHSCLIWSATTLQHREYTNGHACFQADSGKTNKQKETNCLLIAALSLPILWSTQQSL